MEPQSKAQKAALSRVEQISAQLSSDLKARRHNDFGTAYPSHELGDVEKDFESFLKEVASLVKEYELDGSTLKDFKTKACDVFYEEASIRGSFSWQAQFAKKHQM